MGSTDSAETIMGLGLAWLEIHNRVFFLDRQESFRIRKRRPDLPRVQTSFVVAAEVVQVVIVVVVEVVIVVYATDTAVIMVTDVVDAVIVVSISTLA